MRCEPQETVIEREVRYYRCPSLINDQLLRRARRKEEDIRIFRGNASGQRARYVNDPVLSYTQRAVVDGRGAADADISDGG